MGLFDSLRGALGDVKSRLAALGTEISALENERTEMAGDPLPYADFVALQCESIEKKAAEYIGFFSRQIHSSDTSYRFFMNPIEGQSAADFETRYGQNPLNPFNPIRRGEGSLDPEAVYFIFSDLMKQRMKELLDATMRDRWPQKVGLTRKERLLALKKLSDRIAKLAEERDGIRNELAGVEA